MQQEKYQHPVLNLETGGTVAVSSSNSHNIKPTSAHKNLFAFLLIFLAGIAPGIGIGIAGSNQKVTEAENLAKVEQLQRQKLLLQVQKFCSENGGRK